MIPPKKDELELSVFGPGIGECVVVHLGDDDWMIVDSCLNEAGDRAVALEYLRKLNIDVETCVKLVVVTHWHDDHIGGFAQIVRSAKSAELVWSAALNCREFFTLVTSGRQIRLVEHMSGVTEFSEILESLSRRSGGRDAVGPDRWAQQGMRLYHRHTSQAPVTVWALSPSAQTVTDAKLSLARLMPQLGPPRGRLPNPGPNALSTALVICTGRTNLLLGSDLEAGRTESLGWRAIVASPQPELLSPSGVYKVAHHGSENADLEEVWVELLTGNPFAILTPYARGVKPLPSEADVSRLKRRTDNLFSTAYPPTKAPETREPAVERTMREITLSRRAIRKRPGQVRLRVPMGGSVQDIRVELFDGALQL